MTTNALRDICLGVALCLVASGCGTSGEASYSDVYDSDRDQVFDAMKDAFDAYYDLDEVDRRGGQVTTFYDMSHAAAVFSKDGWRAKGEGRITEERIPGDPEGRKGWQAEVKIHFETNQDKDEPLNPRAVTADWRSQGTNPTLAQQVILYMDTLLKDYGPSDTYLREHPDER